MSDHHVSTEEGLIQGRRDKHQDVLAAGGYPYRFERTAVAGDLHDEFHDLDIATQTDETVTVAGRLMLKRSFGKLQFGTLRDMTGTIQLFVDQSSAGDGLASEFAEYDLGDWVGAPAPPRGYA